MTTTRFLAPAMDCTTEKDVISNRDVALMRDDLRGVPELIALSRRTAQTLRISIGLSIGNEVVFFVLALAGIANLWMAVFADMGASLIVAVNGLSLLRSGTGSAS